ncbi:hypothetical protein [Prochlorococcus sp. MIT 1307]|uniref:hypothetical protein n=1 Tax=Prochlorococcus sp. MIT 1307 TaxID=3096219 RepID=UPI002A75AD4F|nr:hypothetical protein [Prochlorococcus sp. MIT 1307]
MFSIATRLRLKKILDRISIGEKVSLQERIYVDKYADQNQTVATCLRRAQCSQQERESTNSIDDLLYSLDLVSEDPESSYRPKADDLGEWFSGAPSWLGRS